MSREDEAYETPKWRTFWLALGFALVVGVGLVTVLRPELEDEASDEGATEIETPEEQDADELPQE